MGKKKKKDKKDNNKKSPEEVESTVAENKESEKPEEVKKKQLKNKVYEKELSRLQVELVKLQEWVKFNKLKVVIIFEGRDAAGKGA